MMEDGFMSRFLIVSYDGERPLPNKEPPPELLPEDLTQWADLVRQAIRYQTPIDTPPPCVVEVSADAYEKLERFELHCIDSVNATDDEAERQVWNRAHLKAMKVACLLAVADHYLYPQIQMEHAAWALALVRQDIAVFQSRKRNGDIGTDDSARERKLVAFMRDYLLKAPRQATRSQMRCSVPISCRVPTYRFEPPRCQPSLTTKPGRTAPLT